jgi:hypothetical protein
MKINTRNQILGVLLIVQAMLAIVLLFPGGDAGSRPRAALLPDFAIDQVNTITIQDAQTELTLAKDPTGNWVLRSGGGEQRPRRAVVGQRHTVAG